MAKQLTGTNDVRLIMLFADDMGNEVKLKIMHPKLGIKLEDGLDAMQEILDAGILLSSAGLPLTIPMNIYYYQQEKEYIVSPTEANKMAIEKATASR